MYVINMEKRNGNDKRVFAQAYGNCCIMPPVLTGAGSSMLFCPIAMDVKIKAVKASNTVFIPK